MLCIVFLVKSKPFESILFLHDFQRTSLASHPTAAPALATAAVAAPDRPAAPAARHQDELKKKKKKNALQTS